MTRLKKRTGEFEEFSEAKLRASLLSAGASEEHARKVCEIVASRSSEGMQTAEVRRMAATELSRMDSAAAQKYETFARR